MSACGDQIRDQKNVREATRDEVSVNELLTTARRRAARNELVGKNQLADDEDLI